MSPFRVMLFPATVIAVALAAQMPPAVRGAEAPCGSTHWSSLHMMSQLLLQPFGMFHHQAAGQTVFTLLNVALFAIVGGSIHRFRASIPTPAYVTMQLGWFALFLTSYFWLAPTDCF